MNDIRRSILWIVFSLSMVLIWDRWQIHNGHSPTFFPSPTAPSQAKSAAPAPALASVPAAQGTAAMSQQTALPVPITQHTVSTDVLKLVFSSEGGSIVQAQLLQHAQDTGTGKKPQGQPLTLLNQSATSTYVVQTGLIQGSFPTHKTPMRLVPAAASLAPGQSSLQVRFESPEVGGLRLIKTYTLTRGHYDIAVKHDIINTSGQTVTPQLYLQLVRDGHTAGKATPFYSTFTGPAIYTDAKKYQKITFDDLEKNKTDFDKNASNGYVAMVQHYFATAWIPPEAMARENFARKIDTNLYSVGAITSLPAIAPGQTHSTQARLFIGPQEEKILENITPGLELVKDYGWFTILAKPLYWILEKIHTGVSNWGWSIVLLVLLIKAVFYLPNASAYKSMAKMKAISPKIMEMRERLKDNPQKVQQEMIRIYREEKVNPVGGCLPIIIQMPVFIALYWVLLSSIEMRNAPWIGWITDLSSPDPYYVLPLIMAITTMIQTALNPLPPDPLQAKLMWFMPLAFSVMFFFFPSGLVLYWITNNILTIAQQSVINTRMGMPIKFTLPTELFRNKPNEK